MTECAEEDEMVVSLTDSENVHDFIRYYLREAHFENTKTNRHYVEALMKSYRGEWPVRYVDLIEHIDRLVKGCG